LHSVTEGGGELAVQRRHLLPQHELALGAEHEAIPALAAALGLLECFVLPNPKLFADVDGDELVSFVPKTLQRMLRKDGVKLPEPVAAAILRQRDSVLDCVKLAGTTGEVLDCPLCMEPYADDETECHVPRTLPCGHTASQECFAKMLRPIAADKDVKKLACPECRVVTEVLRGRADSLQKNFALLR